MATDLRGHTVPAAGDAPSRAALLSLGLTVRDPIPVANTTTRAALIVSLAAATPAVVPSTSNPVYVNRADAAVGAELEVTTDGTTWRTIYSDTTTWTTITLDAGVTVAASFPTLAYRLENGGTQLHVRGTRLQMSTAVTAGTDYNLASGANVVAAAARPVNAPAVYKTIYVYLAAQTLGELKLTSAGAVQYRSIATGTATQIEFDDAIWQL